MHIPRIGHKETRRLGIYLSRKAEGRKKNENCTCQFAHDLISSEACRKQRANGKKTSETKKSSLWHTGGQDHERERVQRAPRSAGAGPCWILILGSVLTHQGRQAMAPPSCFSFSQEGGYLSISLTDCCKDN